ncbi:DEAD/DEAH box helicase [Kiloniella laminariae]|uniref:DEAD/DEAH box helicase n=1 Tax=Kiloniella laminariae TaxID=454162 RepID=UPI000524D61B|nr:DEAD/DEAH box helicase [Kiloniella laminariae]
MTQFSELNLIEPLQRAIDAQGFTTPTAIQEQAIPALLNGKDVIGLSQTGGGKTAAFVLPLLQRLTEENKRFEPNHPQALILAPTREIAQQIGQVLRLFTKFLPIRYTTVTGGAPMFPQFRDLNRGVHILVATPGRLVDHINRGSVKLDNTTTLILDEADRMLDLGFSDEVTEIANSLPKPHQTVLFSATMPKAVDRLVASLLNDPVRIETAPQSTTSANIAQRAFYVHGGQKQALLNHILDNNPGERVLVFMQTKAEADRWSDALRDDGRRVDAIHGDKQQRIRTKVLNKFRRGDIDVLVATDVAARGIDVPGIKIVVNIDLPTDPENYVHRIGRTGRAEATGEAYSFCSPKEIGTLKRIERVIRQDITVVKDHPFHVEISARDAASQKPANRRGGRPFKSGGGNGRGGRDGAGRGDDAGRGRSYKPRSAQNTNGNGQKRFGKRQAA